MKKLLLITSLALMCGSLASADVTTVATLFTGSHNVTWDNTLKFDATQFDDAKVGDFIYLTFSNTTDVLELKTSGEQLPGSRYTWLGEGMEHYSCYITEEGLAALKTDGLELCGANFTVTGVEICNDGFVMPEGAVWGGYFWVADWNTLEIYKIAFKNYDGEKYMIVNLSDDNGDNTNYVINVRTSWQEDGVIALNDAVEKTAKMAIINLEDVNLPALLETTDRVMIQGNPEGGNPFNFTSVVLTNSLPSEGGETDGVKMFNSGEEIVNVYNLQGVIMKKGVSSSEALDELPKGMYILKGETLSKKVVK